MSIALWNHIFLTIKIIVVVCGTAFNGVVVWTLLKNVTKLSPPNILILSIAISDFFACSIAVPIAVRANLAKEWPLESTGCQAHAFMSFLFGLVSITHLATIAVEKYLTIVKTVVRGYYFSNKQILIIVAALWLYSLLYSIAPLAGWSRYDMEGTEYASCSIKWDSTSTADLAYFFVVFLGCFLAPVAVIFFSYYKIYKVNKRVLFTIARYSLPSSHQKSAAIRKQRKTALHFFVVILAFLVSWTPYAVVSIIIIFSKHEILSLVAISAPSVFAKLSFLCNSILYALIYKRIRREILKVVFFCRKVDRAGTELDTGRVRN